MNDYPNPTTSYSNPEINSGNKPESNPESTTSHELEINQPEPSSATPSIPQEMPVRSE